MTAGDLRVGIDIGGTKTDAVVIAPDGHIGQQLRLPTGFGPEAVVEAAVTAVTQLAGFAGVSIADFSRSASGFRAPLTTEPVASRTRSTWVSLVWISAPN